MEYKDEEPEFNEVLGDRYLLQNLIGSGGMANIYVARDLQMDRAVAVKVLHEFYGTYPKFVRRFQIEAKAAASLHHPNVVQVYDYGQTDGNYYIVMELVEGIDLYRYLRSRGVLDVGRAIIIAHDVALGLSAAHRRGIVHRDVKPQNVLIGKDGSIKLADFGIASVYTDMNVDRLTTAGMTLGSVLYFAPEQAQGEIVSPAADVYALGIVLYEMLTGHTPFDGNTPVVVAMQHLKDQPDPPSQFNPYISPALEQIILRCLEKAPEMRFQDGSQLARALERFGDAEMDATVSITPGHKPIPTTFTQTPSRQSKSGHGGSVQTVLPLSRASSYANRMEPGASCNHNRSVPVPRSLIHQSMPNHGDWVYASIITTIILLATLVMLGFSVYLAVQLGYFRVPFFGGMAH
jgi:serine/threonine protein kinase